MLHIYIADIGVTEDDHKLKKRVVLELDTEEIQNRIEQEGRHSVCGLLGDLLLTLTDAYLDRRTQIKEQ